MSIAPIILFLVSCGLIIFAGKWVVSSLLDIARFLGWKEFVVAFFAFSLGSVAPEFFIGISSALHGIPELSLGNIIGQNILLLTVTVAVSALVLRGGIRIQSQTVKVGSTFAVIAAVLPLIMVLDGTLSRIDGLILILTFAGFTVWLFSKKERFSKIYQDEISESSSVGLNTFFKKIFIFIGSLALLVVSAEGIIRSSLGFAEGLGFSVPFVGLLIVAIGTGLPETYISFNLAKRGQSWMILGGLMGAVALSSTMVLGLISVIQPIVIPASELAHLTLARIFLLLSALFFLFFVKTGRQISKKEAIFLLLFYAVFVFSLLYLPG